MEDVLLTLENVLQDFLMFIPNILKALVLFLIAWGVAVLARKLVRKLLDKVGLKERLAKSKTPADVSYGEERVKDIAQIAYYFVFILFLPGIFDALELNSVSGPIATMMNGLLAYLPNILGAALILVVGYFVAKVLRDLTFTLLQTINVDKWYNKVSADKEEVKVKAETKLTLANVLSNIVFGLVLIPVITSALETLAIDSLTQPIVLVLNKTVEMLPNVLVALILVTLGYYIAKFVANILEQLLERAGINKLLSWVQSDTTTTMHFNLASIIATVVQVLIMLFISVEALSILKLQVLNTIGSAVIAYLPLLVSGLLIIGGGVIAGYFVEGLINKYAKSPFTAAIAKYFIIVFAVFMTLEQIRFASTIVNVAFLLVLGGLSVAFALAFGLGGREFAGRQLEAFERKVERENKKPVPENNVIDKIKKDH